MDQLFRFFVGTISLTMSVMLAKFESKSNHVKGIVFFPLMLPQVTA